jgi:hypothetical protein
MLFYRLLSSDEPVKESDEREDTKSVFEGLKLLVSSNTLTTGLLNGMRISEDEILEGRVSRFYQRLLALKPTIS